jgi:hypothetical protein
MKIHQIYYLDEQKPLLLNGAIPYFNENLTVYFENEVIRKLGLNQNEDYFGVFSWKFKEKRKLDLFQIQELIERNPNFDVYSFFKDVSNKNIFKLGNVWHPRLMECLEYIVRRLKLNDILLREGTRCIILQNHFIMKGDLYKRYVVELLEPVMEMMDEPEFKKILYTDSNYLKLVKKRKDKILPQLNKLGLDYYPMHPFLLEMLPSLFMNINKDLTFKQFHYTYGWN